MILLGRDEIDASILEGLFNESSSEANGQLTTTNIKAETNDSAYQAYKTAAETHNKSASHSTSPSGRHKVLPQTPREYELASLTLPDPSQALCLGGCNQRGERQWSTVKRNSGEINPYRLRTSRPSRWQSRYYEVVTIASHKEACGVLAKYNLEELAGNLFWHAVPCEEHYYKCDPNNTCPNVKNHLDYTDPADGGVVCDIEGCTLNTPYDPASSSGGLHAYCNECYQYKCNGKDHSWYPSCSDTTHKKSNSLWDSCTVAGYACVSHTAVYVPGPPRSLSASTGPYSGSVTLSWTAPSSNGGANITYYRYQYRRKRTIGWTDWSSWYPTIDSNTSKTVNGLQRGKRYEFKVKAKNSGGYGPPTSTATATSKN